MEGNKSEDGGLEEAKLNKKVDSIKYFESIIVTNRTVKQEIKERTRNAG
jgi:hypothetical protein